MKKIYPGIWCEPVYRPALFIRKNSKSTTLVFISLYYLSGHVPLLSPHENLVLSPKAVGLLQFVTTVSKVLLRHHQDHPEDKWLIPDAAISILAKN